MGKEIYVGLDIGTDSVGYAVTDTNYNLVKYKGEPMWGSTVFEAAKTKAERRGFRTARRRLDRRQQRIKLTQEIFAKAIAEVDDKFYIRIKESGLYREDTSINSTYFLFQDKDYTDKDFHKQYPTIHHLICDLMADEEPKDVRLVYLAVAWLMAHRGHFLNEVNEKNVSQVVDFDVVYHKMMQYFEDCYGYKIWDCDEALLKEALKKKMSVTRKEKAILDIVNGGKKYKDSPEDEISKACLVKLLAGGKLKPEKLFFDENLSEVDSIGLGMPEEDFARIVAELGDQGELLLKLRGLYDWALLADILQNSNTLSEAKVAVYEQHKADLECLKVFVKKYVPQKYYAIFRDEKNVNYASYSGNSEAKKCGKEEFCDFLKKQLKDIAVEDADKNLYEEMLLRIESCNFLPKQVDGDNRVIPYQLYWDELNTILEKAKAYLPFLNEKSDGYSNAEKLLSIFKFRVPYFVGPLNNNSTYAWMKRKAGAVGKIYPWNFENMVDLDASEKAFIDRMTNTCSYLPGEDVLPKSSLLYCEFMVLNEINNIKVNDIAIPVEVKELIFNKFKEYKKMTPKKIQEVLISNGCMKKGDVLSGIDISIKSSLSSYHAFRRLLESGILNENEVEEIIQYMTYSEDKNRLKRWLQSNYAKLSAEDQKYILGQKFKDFGRLSRKFLQGISYCDETTGEILTIMGVLRNTNDNLMQILSDKYAFGEIIEGERKAYYADAENGSIEKMLDDMYISNSVKRPIYRTLAILDDIRKATKTTPKRIFVEMARGGGEKGKRTQSRRNQIQELYASFNKQEVRDLSKLLEGKSDRELQSEVLFLYFMQMGRCMYSDEEIDIEELKTSKYNVDHIYPQSKVKDDSLTNKVLVLSTLNSEKGNGLVPAAWRNKMQPLWSALLDKKMISEEKYKRLMRSKEFAEEELQGFINRQLVETRQSTKALTNIIKHIYPDTEIVYVKAGLVSDFRHEYDLLKCRSVNDLHHGKDAYLNIVCGNVYHCRFTKNFSTKSDYSLKTETLFAQKTRENGQVIWNGSDDIGRIKKIVSKNNLHYTRFAFEKKGALFHQMPEKKGKGAVPRKAELAIKNYGGYNNSTASFYLMVRYSEKKKTDIMIMPVDLYAAEMVMLSEKKAMEYARKNIADILDKGEEEIRVLELPLGLRKIKVNTVFRFDGFKMALASKSNRGKNLVLSSLESLKMPLQKEIYVKKLEKAREKLKNKIISTIDSEYDGISIEVNVELFDLLNQKLQASCYKKILGNNTKQIINAKDKFLSMSLEEQVEILINLIALFKEGRTVGCDLQKLGGGKAVAVITVSSKVSNWSNNFKEVYLMDISPSGIYESSSDNLLELL